MYIDGQWIQAENDASFDVFNPATGEKIGAWGDLEIVPLINPH